MDSNDDVSTDENVLTFNVSDDALERAVAGRHVLLRIQLSS